MDMKTTMTNMVMKMKALILQTVRTMKMSFSKRITTMKEWIVFLMSHGK